MLSPLQLQINRRATKAFIGANPVALTLAPHTLEATATGGRRRVPGVPRSPQILTLVEPSSSGYTPPQTVTEGSGTSIDFMLIGEYTAQIAKHDTFTYDGNDYEVVQMMVDNGYEVRAMVMRDGG